jgi:hypothetical protein
MPPRFAASRMALISSLPQGGKSSPGSLPKKAAIFASAFFERRVPLMILDRYP